LIDQVKTLIEKWCYFLKHGSTWNFERMIDDNTNVFGNDAIFKSAYGELDRDYWSREEIDIYEQGMQKDARSLNEGGKKEMQKRR
jgi:hypothetical protein